MKLNLPKLPSRKPKWHAGAQWRWEFIGIGYIWLPNSRIDSKVLRIEDQDTFNSMAAMLDTLNAPSHWQKLKNHFRKETKKTKPYKGLTALDLAIGQYEASHQPATIIERKKSRGKVIKGVSHPEFNPNQPQNGGRIVKVMPRKLQKIKNAQEKFEKESVGPSVEELED